MDQPPQDFVQINSEDSDNQNWNYQEDIYQEQASAVKLATQAFQKGDSNIITKNNKISPYVLSKSKLIFDKANKSRGQSKKYASGQDMIFKNWVIQEQKYKEFSSDSQNYSDNEIQIDLPIQEDVLDIIDGDKTYGIILFFSKTIQAQKKIQFRINKLKGHGEIPEVQFVEKKKNFYLYQAKTVSDQRKFQIILESEKKKLATSKPYSFKSEIIDYNANLSYNLLTGQLLETNQLQTILASIYFNNVNDISFWQRAKVDLQKKKNIFLQNESQIDSYTCQILLDQKNAEKTIVALQILLSIPDEEILKKSRLIKNKTYIKLAQIYMTLMMTYVPNLIQEERLINSFTIEKYVKLFLHFRCISDLNKQKMSILETFKQEVLNKKVSQFILLMIQNKKLGFITYFFDVLNQLTLPYLGSVLGFDTLLNHIKDSIVTFDEDYIDLMSSIIYYFTFVIHLQIQNFFQKLTQFVIQSFTTNEYQFKNNEIEGEQQETKTNYYFTKIAQNIKFPKDKLNIFQDFYITFMKINPHLYFKSFTKNPILIKQIATFIKKLPEDIIKMKFDLGKIQYGLGLLKKIYFDYNADKQFKLSELSNLCNSILSIGKKKGQIQIIVQKHILFPLLISGDTKQHRIIAQTICQLLASQISWFPFKEAIKILDEPFTNSIFAKQKMEVVYLQSLLNLVLTKFISKNFISKIVEQASPFQNWHNQFKYKKYLNQVILQKVAKETVNYFTNVRQDERDKKQYFKNLVQKIQTYARNDEEKEGLLCIIETDNFNIEEAEIMKILSSNKGKLSILKKIKQTKGQRSQELKIVLQKIQKNIKNNEINFQNLRGLANNSEYQRNLMIRIFDAEVVTCIQEKRNQGNVFIQKITKYNSFVISLTKFQTSDQKEVKQQLKRTQDRFQKQSIKFNKIQDTTFQSFNQNVLKCYTFQSFFGNQNLSGLKVKRIVQRCNQLYKRFINARDLVIEQFTEKKLTYKSLDFFKAEITNVKLLKEIFLMDNDKVEGIDNLITELMEVLRLIQQFQNQKLVEILNILIQYVKFDQTKRLKEFSTQIIDFLAYAKTIQRKNKQGNISNVFVQFDKLNIEMTKMRLDLNDKDKSNYSLLKFLAEMWRNKDEGLKYVVSIKRFLKQLKTKYDEQEDMSMSINYGDLQSCEVLASYSQTYLLNLSKFKELIKQTKISIQNSKSLVKAPIIVFCKLNQLKNQIENLKNKDRKTLLTVSTVTRKSQIMIQVNQELGVQVRINYQNNEQRRQGKVECISQAQLLRLKEQSIVFLVQNGKILQKQDEETYQRVQQIKSFLQILKRIDTIKQTWEQLQQWGYTLFKSVFIKLEIKNQQCPAIAQKNQELLQIKYQWIRKVKSIQKISQKAAVLQGHKIKSFYQVLTLQQYSKNAICFANICNSKFIQKFRKQKKPKFIDDGSFNNLDTITDFFTFLKTNQNENIPPNKDFNESYIKSSVMSEQNEDFINGIVELDPQRIKRLSLSQLLICNSNTTILDVKAFIQTALLDNKNQYVIIRPQKLPNKFQQYIINCIDQYKKENNNKLLLKICLITNTTLEALYKYLKDQLPNIKQQKNKAARQQAFKQFMQGKIKDVSTYVSLRPGYGKTTKIRQDCINKKRQLFLFPISGCPTAKFLFDRIQKIVFQMDGKKQPKNISLALQISNIDESHLQIVNTFLQEVVAGKAYKYDAGFAQLPQDVHIYIQIQNLTGTGLQKNKYNALISLPFLKQINKHKNHNLVEINSLSKIKYNPGDIQTSYILKHLKMLKNKEIDKHDIPHFQDYKLKPQQMPEKEALQLFDEFFIQKLKNPTFYQYEYFVRLVFDGVKNFSKSYYLSTLNFSSNYDAVMIDKFKLKEIRSKFLGVIVQNSTQFIQRNVEYDEFDSSKAQAKKQHSNNLPFLIIPNIDGQSFSFVYTDADSVPESIRNFYVSQSPDLLKQLNTTPDIKNLFKKHSLTEMQKTNQASFNNSLTNILHNISGNKNYFTKKQPGYVVNLDNFFKMCLITLRMRQNIPIVIMGEAGIGKTAILKHVVTSLYEHQFLVININAGTTIQQLQAHLVNIQKLSQEAILKKKKLWVFFDQFNTLKEVGYIKQIMIEKSFFGKKEKFLNDVVIIGACNPFRKLKQTMIQNQKQMMVKKKIKEQTSNLAFHVLPPPHSMIQCMWNYGSLSPYEYKMYISRMLSAVDQKLSETVDAILQIHNFYIHRFDSSSVSLRDIQRFRKLYVFFCNKLPNQGQKRNVSVIAYNKVQLRALILSFHFCYTLRLQTLQMKDKVWTIIAQQLKVEKLLVTKCKELQEDDFYSRLNIQFQSIAKNSAIKENIYACFVCTYNKLPMIIVGQPGCSKSLAIRILCENMKGVGSTNNYFKNFQSIRSFNFQGSQLCTSQHVQGLFSKAKKAMLDQGKIDQKVKNVSIPLIIFDQIGLADKSKSNPLKVLHPYLEVNQENKVDGKIVDERVSFIGISNTDLDVSKMSRMLVLRRPAPSKEDLIQTAKGIGKSFQNQHLKLNMKIQALIQNISNSYFDFVKIWTERQKMGYKNFFSLRDFYSLIKQFLSMLATQRIDVNNEDTKVFELIQKAIYKNFNGQADSVHLFVELLCKYNNKVFNPHQIYKQDCLDSVLDCFKKQNLRFPLLIVPDLGSISYLVNFLENKFRNQTVYYQKSPFKDDKESSNYVIQTTTNITQSLKKGQKIILNNIQSTIQTSLYDMFNKFYIKSGDENYCKIATSQTGLVKTVKVHQSFNCIVIILQNELMLTQPPFLSRFEKHRFSIDNTNMQKRAEQISQRIEVFKKQLMQQVVEVKLNHYTFESLFINCSKPALKTLILRILNQQFLKSHLKQQKSEQFQQKQQKQKKSSNDFIVEQIIRQMVMNCSQQFNFIFKYIIEKRNNLRFLQQISQALKKKFQFQLQKNSNLIIFTTEKQVCQRQHQKDQIKIIQTQFIKHQESFDEQIDEYINSKNQFLYLQLKFNEANKILYLVSQIQKLKKRLNISGHSAMLKNKHIYFLLEMNRQEQKQGIKSLFISYLSNYRQIFYQGKIDELKTSKQQFFKNIFSLKKVLSVVFEFFQFQYKTFNIQSVQKMQIQFNTLLKDFQNVPENQIYKNCEDYISQTVGVNIQLNQNTLTQILQDVQSIKKCKNLKQAITKNLAQKQYNAVVAMFLKYLFEKQALMCYSPQIYQIFKLQMCRFDIATINRIQAAKRSPQYTSVVREILKSKYLFIKAQYTKLKNIKRLPSLERIISIVVNRPRLFHFSKAQLDVIFNKQDAQNSLSALAKKCIIQNNNNKFSKQHQIFIKEFNRKSTFVLKSNDQQKQNLYTNYINSNSDVKELLLLDLITDLCETYGLKFQFIMEFKYLVNTFIVLNNCSFQKIVMTLLAFQNVFVQIFKLFTIIFQHKIILPAQFKNRISKQCQISFEIMTQYCNSTLITNFFSFHLSRKASINQFGGAKQFYQIFINSMFQLQSLQKICQNLIIPKNLLLARDVILFFSEYDQQKKYQLTADYMINMKDKETFVSAYKFTQTLYEKQTNAQKKNLILKFQANKIFLQWFMNQTNPECIRCFIQKCDKNATFCHNSIAIINYLLGKARLNFEQIQSIIEILNKNKKVEGDLVEFGNHCKQQKYSNNLSVLLVNLFFQKLLKVHSKKSDKQIIQQNLQNFKLYYPKLCVDDAGNPLFHLFLIAYIKKILISYMECIKLKQNIGQPIGQLLNKQNQFSKNCRFFCIKILRKTMISKQIKDNFVKVKRFEWAQKIQQYFKQEQARAIIVPKDNIQALSKQFVQLMNTIQKSQGSDFQSLGKLIWMGKNNFQLKYSILNFFFRYYYTLSYNDKVFKAKTIQYLQKQKANIQLSIGKYETELILDYVQNKVTSEIHLQSAQNLNEDHLILMNFINLFLASKQSIDPFHSIFFANGVIHPNFAQVISQMFFPCGIQNPYVKIAQYAQILTRNNNIGVYICCSDCDYIYFHQNCGWPSEQSVCPMCGQKIGSAGGHALSRREKGARRLMTPVLVDGNGNYYVWNGNLAKYDLYWQMQRKYIQVQINRMNLKKEVIVNKKVQKLTGYNVCNNERTSNLTYKVFKYLIQAIFYVFIAKSYIQEAEVLTIFNKPKNIIIPQLYQSIKKTLEQIKTDLNLGNKFNGWMFGIQRKFIQKLRNFKNQFEKHVKDLKQEEAGLIVKLQKQLAQKKIKQDILNLYIDFVKVLKNCFFAKEVSIINQFTASSAFTRNFMQNLLEGQIKIRTNESKFTFSVQNQTKQGKMQFPFDSSLTQDQLNQKQFMFARVFKLPDSQIRYNQIVNKYELLIKQNYPLLDLILKQNERFIQMDNFFKVIDFVNQLHKYIENKCERSKSLKPLKYYLEELKKQYNEGLSECLKKPQIMIKAWRSLAKFLGVLQNGCKIIGNMNDEYNMQTQMKAFVLDNSSKQNVYGLIIASLFHNFGAMHNQVTSLLNSRKNLVPSYKNLSLFNELMKVHPQKLKEENVFKISQDEFQQKLYECSVSSINYGQNFIFNNFDAYQDFFLKKLDKKCQIISDLQKMVSICYNGQAFSSGVQNSSNAIAQILQKFDTKLQQDQISLIKEKLTQMKQQNNYLQLLVLMRGSLEKTMIVINSIKGNVKEDIKLTQLFKELNIMETVEKLLTRPPFNEIKTSQIVHLYELLQDQLKFTVFKNLPQKYKEKIPNQMAQQLQQYFETLPSQSNEQSPTLQELQEAISKFIMRNLQSGIFDAQKKLVQFVINRADFWAKDYNEQKKQGLMYNPVIQSVQIRYSCNVLQILEQVKQKRMNK